MNWAPLFALVFAAGFACAMFTYIEFAATRRWPAGLLFASGKGQVYGAGLFIGTLVSALILLKWWFVFFVATGGFALSLVVLLVFRKHTQYVAPVGYVAAFATAFVTYSR